MLRNPINSILDLLERLTKVNVRYFFKNTLLMLLPLFVNSFAKLTQNIAFARFSTENIFGQFAFIMSVLAILTMASLPGLKIATVNSIAIGNIGSFRRLSFVKVKYSFLGMAGCFIVALYYYFIASQPILSSSFVIAGIFFVPYCGYNLWTAFYIGNKKFGIYASLISAISILSIVFILISIFRKASLPIIILAALLAHVIFNLVITSSILRKLPEKKHDIRDGVKFSKHITFIGAIGILFVNLDKIIVGAFLGFQALAIYQVAYSFQNQLKSLLMIETSLIFPKLSELEREKAFLKVKNKFLLITILSVSLGVIGFLVARPLILLFFSKTYESSIVYSQLLILLMSFGFPSQIIKTLFESQNYIKGLYLLNVLFPTIAILLMIPLIYYFGIAGAVIANGVYWIGSYFTSYYLVFVKKDFVFM
ncbi:MAG: oligosaccharide flippase family protein [Candidatus Aureabacteria bacterium]|nr:oligosaccharide flippase family protein [Candidatus Auribacterota bacterium]MCK5160636.1 oligosaccharide flippase family protein [Candidatus Auribacterota bacterium]